MMYFWQDNEQGTTSMNYMYFMVKGQLCLWRLNLCLKALLHVTQKKFCSSECAFIWTFNWLLVAQDFPHTSHLNVCTSPSFVWYIFIWLLYPILDLNPFPHGMQMSTNILPSTCSRRTWPLRSSLVWNETEHQRQKYRPLWLTERSWIVRSVSL